MDFDTETNDLLLAIQIAEELKLNFSERSSSQTIFNNEVSDSEYALKIFQDLNDKPSILNKTNNNESISDENSDYLLALKISENNVLDETTKNLESEQSNSETADLILALKIAEELEQSFSERSSSRTTSNNEVSDSEYALKVFRDLNDPPSNVNKTNNNEFTSNENTDYLLALKMNENYDSEEPNKNLESEKSNSETEDLLLALQIAEELESSFLERNNSQTRLNNEVTDTEYALQIYQDLNGQLPNLNKPINDESTGNENNDYLLALKMSKNSDLDETTVNDDYQLAIQLANNEIDDSPSTSRQPVNLLNQKKYQDATISVADPSWEFNDPNPDIYALFAAFNQRFFWGKLDMVEVKWSPRMTLCAGVCSYHSRAGFCSVRLSKPLLQLRPRKDLVDTLLHEMIHAYLFVTANNRDRDGHGPQFHSHMYRINKEAGSNISVYHSFHDEVRSCKTHWWRCDGPCQYQPPFYGYVKRSMNRAPGPNDRWHANHRATCGGKFLKIKEPEDYGVKKLKRKDESTIETNKKHKTNNLENYFGSQLPLSFGSNANVGGLVNGPNTNNVKSSNVVGIVDLVQSPNVAKRVKPSSRNDISLDRNSKINAVKSFHGSNIVTLGDSNKNPQKNSRTGSPKKSWVPLPGQKNILQFMNTS